MVKGNEEIFSFKKREEKIRKENRGE